MAETYQASHKKMSTGVSVPEPLKDMTCDLCSSATEQFCNDCQVSLCVNCVSQHVDEFKSLTHDIVPFKDRKSQLILTPCPTHSGQRCQAHCQQCDIHVCVKCILGTHKSHPVFEMEDFIQKKKAEIERENQHIESVIIPKFKEEKEKSKNKISESEVRCEKFRKEVESQRELWHEEVDEIFDKVLTKVKFMTNKHITDLKKHQSKLRSMIPNIYQTIEHNKEVLRTNHASTITDHKSKLHEFQEIPAVIEITIHELITSSDKGTELVIELGDYRANLTQMNLPSPTEEETGLHQRELSENATVVANISTRLKNMRGLECVEVDEAWISGEDKDIRRIDLEGNVREAVSTTCPIAPNDIAVTRQGEVLYCDGRNRAVNVVRNGGTEVLLTTPQGWHPDGLCCTRSGDILVSLGTTDFKSRKIACFGYDKEITVKREVNEDEEGNQIFKAGEFALYVAESKNGDICASDQNADIVVAVDLYGRVRFRYNGSSVRGINGFSPRQIVTDSLCRIIVTDALNNCLHILDSRGHMLGYIEDDSLLSPTGLSLDTQGRLWVGLSSGDVKVIQYLQ
uniref:Uncharacterized protein LOC111106461 isoform X1 n=2 Tax=Crassostrea virginica TaxID=6565 RepID=A0A8B8B0J3_CRAVI|nr:uncharacterized protein LOC111106461 isoform X1 [Crassostrea virginica]